MGYRNIFIESNCKIGVRNESISITINSDETLIPLEDINAIIIDNRMCNLSTYLLDKITKNDILLYVCNEKHLPTGILLNINSYCRQLKRIKEQLNMPKPIQKRMWQDIIIKKIENQAMCLKLLGIDGYDNLNILSESVQSGDTTNVESTAAAMYFKLLYGEHYTRRSDIIINSALNYGYAIVRGMIARSLVAYGFEPSIGLFHHSELNNFNLADDIIEVFRPLVDLYITINIPSYIDELNSQVKREIFNVTNQIVLINGKKYNLQTAIDSVISSLSKSYHEGKNCLLLPDITILNEYNFI